MFRNSLEFGVPHVVQLIASRDVALCDACVSVDLERKFDAGCLFLDYTTPTINDEHTLRFIYEHRDVLPRCAYFYQSKIFNLETVFRRLLEAPGRPNLYILLVEIIVSSCVDSQTKSNSQPRTLATRDKLRELVQRYAFLDIIARASCACEQPIALVLTVMYDLGVNVCYVPRTGSDTLLSVAVRKRWSDLVATILSRRMAQGVLEHAEAAETPENAQQDTVGSELVRAYAQNPAVFEKSRCYLPEELVSRVVQHMRKL